MLSPDWPCPASIMLSSTVMRASTFVSWNVRTIPLVASWWLGVSLAGSPSNVTTPASGLSNPVRRLNSVVLPAPLGPIKAVIAPRWTSNRSTSTARMPPNARGHANRGEDRIGFGHARHGLDAVESATCRIGPVDIAARARRHRRQPCCRRRRHPMRRRRRGDGSQRRASIAISLRSPNTPWGRKIISSMRPMPTRMNRTCPTWTPSMSESGKLSFSTAWRNTLSVNARIIQKIIAPTMGPTTPSEATDDRRREREEGHRSRIVVGLYRVL